VRSYELGLTHFRTFLGHERVLAEVDERAVQAFVLAQVERGIKPRTINLHLSALRAFGVWAVATGLWRTNTASLADSVPDDSTPTHTMSSHDVERLIEAGPERGSRWYPVERAVVLLAAGHGLKTGELCRLTWDAVDFADRTLTIAGGPRRGARTVALGAEVLDALRALPERCGAILVSPDGVPLKDRRLRALLAKMGERAGVGVVNFSAVRFAKVAAVVEARAPLGAGQAEYGFAHPSGLLRAAGRFSKGGS
jgi:site-specific recombinase XerD